MADHRVVSTVAIIVFSGTEKATKAGAWVPYPATDL